MLTRVIKKLQNRAFATIVNEPFKFVHMHSAQYKLLVTISNNIEVSEEPVPRTKKIPNHAVKFEAGETGHILYGISRHGFRERLLPQFTSVADLWIQQTADLIPLSSVMK